jgi:RNA polymerase sigma factor (sigma-70 family)
MHGGGPQATSTDDAVGSSYRALLRLMTALHDCRTLTELEHTLTRRMHEVIWADLVTLNKIDLTGNMGGSIGLFEPEFVSPRVIEPAFDRYVSQHPLVQDMQRTGHGRPRRMSDFIDMDAFQQLELYEHVFKPLRSLHQIGLSVTAVPGMIVGIGINRTYEDFTDAELALATLLHEQIPAALHHVQLREIHERERQLDSIGALTEREREVLVYLRGGMSNQQIAEALQVTRRTVEKHLERLYSKLGVCSRTGAVHAVWHADTDATV